MLIYFLLLLLYLATSQTNQSLFNGLRKVCILIKYKNVKIHKFPIKIINKFYLKMQKNKIKNINNNYSRHKNNKG